MDVEEISIIVRIQITKYELLCSSRKYWENKHTEERKDRRYEEAKLGNFIQKFKKGNQRTLIKSIHGWTPVLDRGYRVKWNGMSMFPV